MTVLSIFTGTEVLFFILGILSTLSVVSLVMISRSYNMDWKSWTLSALGLFLLIFSIAWSVSSVLEGEPRAASMGMVFFGIPALICLLLTRRLVVTQKKETI